MNRGGVPGRGPFEKTDQVEGHRRLRRDRPRRVSGRRVIGRFGRAEQFGGRARSAPGAPAFRTFVESTAAAGIGGRKGRGGAGEQGHTDRSDQDREPESSSLPNHRGAPLVHRSVRAGAVEAHRIAFLVTLPDYLKLSTPDTDFWTYVPAPPSTTGPSHAQRHPQAPPPVISEPSRARSSVGERSLHTREVAGSKPAAPTTSVRRR